MKNNHISVKKNVLKFMERTALMLAGSLLPAMALLAFVESPAAAKGKTPQSLAMIKTAKIKTVIESENNEAHAEADLFTLTPRYKTGDMTRYQFTVHRTTDRKKVSEFDTIDTKFRMVMQETTLKTADGGVTLEEKIEQADGDFDEHEIELTAAMPKVTLTRDRQGITLIDTTGGISPIQEPVAEIFQLLARIQRSCLPSVPVRVGDQWKFAWEDTSSGENKNHNDVYKKDSGKTEKDESTGEVNSVGKTNDKSDGKTTGKSEGTPDGKIVFKVDGKTEGTGTLIGPETVNGQPTLKIKLDFTSVLHVPDIRKNGVNIDVTSHFVGTANIDPTTCKFVRLQGTSDDLLPQGEKARTEVSLSLAPPASKKK